jgi:hypothetical protein
MHYLAQVMHVCALRLQNVGGNRRGRLRCDAEHGFEVLQLVFAEEVNYTRRASRPMRLQCCKDDLPLLLVNDDGIAKSYGEIGMCVHDTIIAAVLPIVKYT